jgi:hypothetical protein
MPSNFVNKYVLEEASVSTYRGICGVVRMRGYHRSPASKSGYFIVVVNIWPF